MELKKKLVEHLVFLVSCGYVLPVVAYVSHCMEMDTLDHSHIRHFVAEVLSIVQHPYSSEFSSALEPLVHNPEITGPLVNPNKTDPLSVFIGTYLLKTVLHPPTSHWCSHAPHIRNCGEFGNINMPKLF